MGFWTNSPSLRGRRWPSVAACLGRTRGHPARAEHLEGLEHHRDALMEFYAGAVPEELERLTPEERRRVYRMLRLEISARPDGTLEARAILGENLQVGSENGRAVCDPELALSCIAGWRMQRNIPTYRRAPPREPPP